jgi:hypothetical protein
VRINSYQGDQEMKRFGGTRPRNLLLIAALLFGEGCAAARPPLPPKVTGVSAPVSSPLAPGTRKAYLPLGLVVTGAPVLGSPDWAQRSMKRAVGFMSDDAVRGLADGGVVGWTLLSAYVAYLPVGLAAGALAGELAAKKWQPCLEGLTRELQKLDAPALLARELAETLDKYSQVLPVVLSGEGDKGRQASRRGLKSLLRAEISRVNLRECRQRGNFAVEVALKARLEDLTGQKVFFYQTLVYTAVEPLERVAGEIQTFAPSPCRKMSAYCGPEGCQVFRDEVARGIRYLNDKLLFDLGLWSGSG